MLDDQTLIGASKFWKGIPSDDPLVPIVERPNETIADLSRGGDGAEQDRVGPGGRAVRATRLGLVAIVREQGRQCGGLLHHQKGCWPLIQLEYFSIFAIKS